MGFPTKNDQFGLEIGGENPPFKETPVYFWWERNGDPFFVHLTSQEIPPQKLIWAIYEKSLRSGRLTAGSPTAITHEKKGK